PQTHLDVLMDLAIAEKRPDDVLRWYDRLRENRRGAGFGWYGMNTSAERVADAVAEKHPDRALEIYRDLAEGQIARPSPSAYEEAARPLRKTKALLRRLNRAAEWTQYLAKLREENRRKRRLMEVLDRLEGRPIIEG